MSANEQGAEKEATEMREMEGGESAMCGALCCLTLENIGTCKEHGSAPEARGHGSHHGASQRAGLRAPVNDWSLVGKSERGAGLFPRSREVVVGGEIFGLWSGKTRKRRSASRQSIQVLVGREEDIIYRSRCESEGGCGLD